MSKGKDSKPPSSRFDALFSVAKTVQPETQSEELPLALSKEDDRSLAKHKDPGYQRTTLYLPKALHRKFKAAAVEEEREMSDIMEKLIQQWLEDRKNS